MHNKATRPRGWQTLYCHKLIQARFSTASQLTSQLSGGVPTSSSGSSRREATAKHAFLSADFSHNCARIPNILAQKVYPIKDVINFSPLRGWDAFLKEEISFSRYIIAAMLVDGKQKISLRSKRFQSSYIPSPSPVIHFFFYSCPSFLDEPREETLATQVNKRSLISSLCYQHLFISPLLSVSPEIAWKPPIAVEHKNSVNSPKTLQNGLRRGQTTKNIHLAEGDMGVYGIAVLRFFSCGILVILILTCGIAVSSSSAVCGFSSFWLTVFGEIRLFTVLRCHLFSLSFRYNR